MAGRERQGLHQLGVEEMQVVGLRGALRLHGEAAHATEDEGRLLPREADAELV